MADRFGPKGVIAFLIPAQNANMQREYEAMRPEGVSLQVYRFDISDHGNVAEAVLSVVPSTLGCWPDLIVTGNSIEMRNWSAERQALYRRELAERAGGVPVLTATDATVAALTAVGARNLAAISPMSDEYAASVSAYYDSAGFQTLATAGLGVAESIDIIDKTADDARAAWQRIVTSEIDTLLHVGGALGIQAQLPDLESHFRRPVVSVNTAVMWAACRRLGIDHPIPGIGTLSDKPLSGDLP